MTRSTVYWLVSRSVHSYETQSCPILKDDLVQEGVYDANNIAAEMREALSHLAHESAVEEEAVALDIAAAVYSGEPIQTE